MPNQTIRLEDGSGYYDERRGLVIRAENYLESLRDLAIRFVLTNGLDDSFFRQ